MIGISFVDSCIPSQTWTFYVAKDSLEFLIFLPPWLCHWSQEATASMDYGRVLLFVVEVHILGFVHAQWHSTKGARSSRIFFLKKSQLTLIAHNFLMSFLLVGWGGVKVKSLFFIYENTYIEKIQEKANLHTVKNMQIKVYNSYINIIQCFSLMTQIQKLFTYIITYCARTTMTKIIIFWLSLSFNSQSHLFT